MSGAKKGASASLLLRSWELYLFDTTDSLLDAEEII